MPIGRRIYANVTETAFFKFKERCRNEGLTLAEGLEAICIAYGNGLQLVRPKLNVVKRNENGWEGTKNG